MSVYWGYNWATGEMATEKRREEGLTTDFIARQSRNHVGGHVAGSS
jgi:hypothetical protein